MIKIIKFFYRLFLPFLKLPFDAKKYPGKYFLNLINLTTDQVIRVVGSVWHILFRNKKFDKKLECHGNYKIFPKNINSKSVIYSCGIATNISFDESVSNTFNCNVFMFDPTKKSNEFMRKNINSKLKFYNIGIWINDEKKKFYHQNDPENVDISVTNFFKTNHYIELPCRSIASLMHEFNHKQIDILKMDIEGAAFDILNNLIENKIYPNQIIVELERPFFIYNAKFTELFAYLIKRKSLRRNLKHLGYDLVELKANELLAIKKS